MIKTISMQVIPPREPHSIPTRRIARRRTFGLFAASVAAMVILTGVLIGHRIAQAVPVVRSTATLQQTPVPDAGHAAAMRAAVQSLPAFPDPYPVAAGMAP